MIRVGITIGDPGGVGPELLLQVLNDGEVRSKVDPLVFGDRELLLRLGKRFGWQVDFEIEQAGNIGHSQVVSGRFHQDNARACIAYLHAAAGAIERGRVAALVTGPINKLALATCGETGPGQTEWLANRFRSGQSVMLLHGPRLKVVLATTHLALRDVAGAIKHSDLLKTVSLASRELQGYFFPEGPRLALAALNPHGEENGGLGCEEREVLLPVAAELRKQGVNVQGPVSGDTVFHQAAAGKYDAVVALYHDQGLAPIKALHFAEVVNVTLGLGVIRTSPGHGVAYDLVHKAEADPNSFKKAILLAEAMARADSERKPQIEQGRPS